MNTTGIDSNTYNVNAVCGNCGHKGSISRNKGQEMPDRDKCPNCGCFTFWPQKYFGK